MKIKLKDVSERDNGRLVQMIKDFVPYTVKKLGYGKPFLIKIVSDKKNSSNPLGKTAFYSPEDFSITLFVDNRHDKDILRSLSHEIVHHAQNCMGRLDSDMATGEGYAQKNADLRKLEAEAYLLGNGLLFRDWEDSTKEQDKMNKEENVQEATILNPFGKRRKDPELAKIKKHLLTHSEVAEFLDPRDKLEFWVQLGNMEDASKYMKKMGRLAQMVLDNSPELEEKVSHYDEVNEEWVAVNETVQYTPDRHEQLFEILKKKVIK